MKFTKIHLKISKGKMQTLFLVFCSRVHFGGALFPDIVQGGRLLLAIGEESEEPETNGDDLGSFVEVIGVTENVVNITNSPTIAPPPTLPPPTSSSPTESPRVVAFSGDDVGRPGLLS